MKLLQRMNNLSPDKRAVVTEINNEKEAMENYWKKKEKGTLEVSFDYASQNGDLSYVDDNGITLILTAEEHKKYNANYNARIKDRFIGNFLQLKVKDIDEANKIVYLTNALDRNNLKTGIIKELCQAADNGEQVDVWGTVLFVTPKRITINIFNRNVLGFVDVEDWSYAYIRHLENMVSTGEHLKLRLKGMAPRKSGKEIAFSLSRKELHPNPWDSVKNIEEKGILNVTIIEVPLDKNYAWGHIKRCPDIEIMVNKSSNLALRVGATYKCKVAALKPEEKIFKVSPFELVNTRSYNDDTEAYLKQKGDK